MKSTETDALTRKPTKTLEFGIFVFSFCIAALICTAVVVVVVRLKAASSAAQRSIEQKDGIAQMEQCRTNLLKIEAMMLNWGYITHAASNAIPDSCDLSIYDTNEWDNVVIRCPSDGKYTIGEWHKPPTCTKHGDLIAKLGNNP